MHDMYNVLPVASAAVLFQQRRDGLAGGFDVDGLEVALGVFILGVDDDQCAIRGRGRERWCAQHFAEGLDLSCR